MSATHLIPRPPVVAVMGHIDHGKSTLLDYIRRTSLTEKEVGGITQRLSAYEVKHPLNDDTEKLITFLDTPGHEAFGKIRERGASVADVAVLVVSAEDGVKPQTIDALRAIKASGIPFVVAINKIDKPNADIEKTKMSLAEHEVFLEGFGGDVTAVPISAKTGQGVPDLLDMILLTTDVLEHTGDTSKAAEGIIIESHTTERTGITATVIIKDGTLRVGNFLVCGGAFAPVRFIEDFRGKKIESATFSSPVRIVGWSQIPHTGEICVGVATRKDAEKIIETHNNTTKEESSIPQSTASTLIPIIIKADAQGSLDAIYHEIQKLNAEKIGFKIVAAGVGEIRESDMKLAMSKAGTVIVSFSVGEDKQAATMRERLDIESKRFDIIYELADYLKELLVARTPKETVEELHGALKVLKFFSKVKDKQVLGGRVESGTIDKDATVRIIRREHEIGRGRILEIQSQKIKTSSIGEGSECGIQIEAKMEVAPGDILQSFVSVEK